MTAIFRVEALVEVKRDQRTCERATPIIPVLEGIVVVPLIGKYTKIARKIYKNINELASQKRTINEIYWVE